MRKNLTELIEFIRSASEGLEVEELSTKTPVDIKLLETAIRDTLKEGAGKPMDDNVFEELVIINFIIRANEAGFSTGKIKNQIDELERSKEE